MASTYDIAWAAGLFEGEGSISCYPIKCRVNSIRTDVSLASTDKDVIDKFCQIVGAGDVKGPREYPRRKPIYYWQVQNFRDCMYVLGQIYDYLGERRKAKADEMLEACIPRYLSFYPISTGLHSIDSFDDNL